MAGSVSDSDDGEVGWGSLVDAEPAQPPNEAQDEEVGWNVVSAECATPNHARSSAAAARPTHGPGPSLREGVEDLLESGAATNTGGSSENNWQLTKRK